LLFSFFACSAGLIVRRSSSLTLLTSHRFCHYLPRRQPAIAHRMFDLGPTQTDVG
jgi:hypothetical protein